MYLGNNAALLGCQEYFNRCAAAGSPIGATQTPSSYDNAASFNGTNQFLSIPSNSTLQLGGQAFSFSVWFNVRDVISQKPFLSKIALNNFEYMFGTAGSSIRLIGGNASNAWAVNLAGGNFSANRWNHAVCTYDGTSVVTIYLNGTSVGTSTASITTSGANQFQISSNSAYGEFLIGDLASVGFWKKALTASEVTQLWNSGAGRTYASLDSGLRTNLVSWWALNQNSVTADSHGTNTLTNNGTVTAPNIGPIVTALSDPRQLIIDFAQGIDRLGLWNSMVCWPLRSSQNAGSGTTAFSLGGLGQFNGTLVNAPVWGANGISSTGSGAIPPSIVLTGTSLSNYSARTWMAIINPFAETQDNVIAITSNYSHSFAGSGQGMQMGAAAGYIRSQAGVNGNFSQIFVSPAPTKNIFSVLGTAWNAGTIQTYVNSSTNNASGTSGLSPMTDSNPIRLMGMNAGGLDNRGLNGIMAGFLDIRTNVSSAQWAAVYNLYRQTLGLGLGLP